jgi:hypothetical protein
MIPPAMFTPQFWSGFRCTGAGLWLVLRLHVLCFDVPKPTYTSMYVRMFMHSAYLLRE